MSLTPAQMLAMMQLTDSLFPTGAFTHSNGLETYVQHGAVQDADSLQALITTRLIHGAAKSDMVAIHAAMAACAAADMTAIAALDEQLSAMKIAREGRDASSKVGRQLLRNGQNLLNDSLLAEYQRAISAGRCAGHHAIAHGLIYAALGTDAQAALLAFAYGIAAGQVSAALKLMPIGPTRAQQILHALIPVMERAVEIALNHTADEMKSFTPGLEIHIMQHHYLFRRLFIS